MSTVRNQPCPCNSGRKYKHCCLHNNQTEQNSQTAPELTAPPHNIIPANFAPQRHMPPVDLFPDWPDDDEDDEDEFDPDFHIMDIIRDLHDFGLKDLPHVKAYKKLRKLHEEILDSMAVHLDQGKFTFKFDDTPEQAGNSANEEPHPSQVLESRFDMSTKEGMQAYYDIHIYKMSPYVNSITEEFIRTNRYKKPEKIALLHSMNSSVCGLFEVISIDSDQGYVSLQEVFTHQTFKIVDVSMSSTPDAFDNHYVYMRIITADEISFSSGVNLIFEKSDRFIKDFIKRNKANYTPNGKMLRFIELYNRYTEDSNRIAFKRHEVR